MQLSLSLFLFVSSTKCPADVFFQKILYFCYVFFIYSMNEIHCTMSNPQDRPNPLWPILVIPCDIASPDPEKDKPMLIFAVPDLVIYF